MNTRSVFLPLWTACALCAQAPQPQPSLQTSVPGKAGEPVRFVFLPPPGVIWATLFVRAEGEDDFRSLTMRPADGKLVAELLASEVGSRSVQYYLAYKLPAGIQFLPADAPTSLGSLDLGSSSAPGKAPTSLTQRFPFHVEGSLEQQFYHSPKVSGERTFSDAGQIGFGYEADYGEHHLSLATRVAYQGQPAPGQSHWTVGELRGRWNFRSHQTQIGDMAFQESEFSVGGSGRRGMDYLYDDQVFYTHVFAVNTEQLEGFRGLVWPTHDTGLFGLAAGYSWMKGRVQTKVVLLTGRDDPAQGVNLGYMPTLTRREGSTGAVTFKADLANHRLSLNGEYARTSYDKDLDDLYGKVQDQAWRVGGAWSDRAFSARFTYRQIGRDFGTIGYPVMEGDRRGMDGGMSLNLGSKWSINASFTSERNNPNADPMETRARNDAQSLDAQWSPGHGVTVRFGLSHGSQEAGTPSGSLVPFSDSRRAGAVAGMDWALGAKGSVSFSYQYDRLEGTGANTSTGRSSTLMLGGSYWEADLMRISPSLSFAKSTDDITGQDSKVFSAFLNSEVTLVKKWLNLALNGGYNRMDAPGLDAMITTNVDAALQYNLSPYLQSLPRRGQAQLALHFRYTRVQILPEADRRASLSLNFAF